MNAGRWPRTTPSHPSGSWAHAAEAAAVGVARVATGATRDLIDLLVPGRCAACGELAINGLCADCLAGCRCVEAPVCRSCGSPWPGRDRPCGRCLRFGRAFAFRRALAMWRYRGPVRRLVHGFKYEGRRDVLRLFGRRLGEAASLTPLFAGPGRPLLIPVPARRVSARKRGYDQAVGLAVGLATSRGLPVELRALRRRRETPVAQSASPGHRRRRQLGAAFRARPSRVGGRRVLLVDDVLSTGGTADAASRALLCAGASSVDVVVLAT